MLLLSMMFPGPILAQTSQHVTCQFILGFRTLYDLASSEVGDCVDNQASASNGDAQPYTTKGLMARRKADDWTAFTNGCGPGPMALAG